MRRLRWLWPLAVVALLLALPWIVHATRGERRLEIVVVDKTVPFENLLEHRALFWLLDHLKIRNPDGRRYAAAADYVGVFPGAEPGDPPSRTTTLTGRRLAGADLVYLADTYGVYERDLESGRAMRAALERSPKIHGGLEVAEARAVATALSAGTTVVAEFNTLASPTGAEARQIMESLLGVRWTGWIGRFFAALDDEEEVPGWVRRNYELEWGEPWEFAGAGWVLLKNDAHVEVLRAGIETEGLDGLVLERTRPLDPLLAGARDDVRYVYWFDVVEVAAEARVLASYHWKPTAAGRERLRARGLPEGFPAVVRRNHAAADSFYFAGDFVDNPLPARRVPLAGYPAAMRWLEGARIAPAESAFYWRFYVPLMRRVLASRE